MIRWFWLFSLLLFFVFFFITLSKWFEIPLVMTLMDICISIHLNQNKKLGYLVGISNFTENFSNFKVSRFLLVMLILKNDLNYFEGMTQFKVVKSLTHQLFLPLYLFIKMQNLRLLCRMIIFLLSWKVYDLIVICRNSVCQKMKGFGFVKVLRLPPQPFPSFQIAYWYDYIYCCLINKDKFSLFSFFYF